MVDSEPLTDFVGDQPLCSDFFNEAVQYMQYSIVTITRELPAMKHHEYMSRGRTNVVYDCTDFGLADTITNSS